MSDQQPRPPYPPAPPYPQQGGIPQPPRPVGAPPHVPGMKMPVKMPPRPMGYPMPPAGVKMPPRPVGAPPMAAYPPAAPATPPAAAPQPPASVPVPVQEEMPVEEEYSEGSDADENGYIDDLPDYPQEEETEKPLARKNDDDDPYRENMASDLGLPPVFIKTKMLVSLFLLFFALGCGAGYVGSSFRAKDITGGGSGMRGVDRNSEIPKGRPRCGLAQKGQGCVLYLMNTQRREIEGRDFFESASVMLGVPRFQIETANIRYSTKRIPPGYIALLNIPPTQ